MAKTIPPGFESLFLCQTVPMAGVAEWFEVAPCEGGCQVRPTRGSNPLPGPKSTRNPLSLGLADWRSLQFNRSFQLVTVQSCSSPHQI